MQRPSASGEDQGREQPAQRGVEQATPERAPQHLALAPHQPHGGAGGDDVVGADDVADGGAEALRAQQPSARSGPGPRRSASWKSVNRMFEAVADPVTKVPSRPTKGAASGHAGPAAAAAASASASIMPAWTMSRDRPAWRSGRASPGRAGGGRAHGAHVAARAARAASAAPQRSRAAASCPGGRAARSCPEGDPVAMPRSPAERLAQGARAGSPAPRPPAPGRARRRPAAPPGAAVGRARRAPAAARRRTPAPTREPASVGSSGPTKVAIRWCGTRKRRRRAASSPRRPPVRSLSRQRAGHQQHHHQRHAAPRERVVGDRRRRRARGPVKGVTATCASTGVPTAPNDTPTAWPISAIGDGLDATEAGGDQEGRGQRHRGAEPGGALDEQDEEPGHEQRQDAGSPRGAHRVAQHVDRAGAQLQLVDAQGGEDDPQDRGGDEQRLEQRAAGGRERTQLRRVRVPKPKTPGDPPARWPGPRRRPAPPTSAGRAWRSGSRAAAGAATAPRWGRPATAQASFRGDAVQRALARSRRR
jgi:hypothetical protein